ncbi:MAG: S9 family peptidase [Proteobacteria bacterium]|nr:MAG: S9 family peptidase [Pseudomonadota bacterium]
MRTIISICFIFFLAACQQPSVKISPDSAADDFKVYDTEAFFDTTRLFGSSLNFDGSAVLVSSNETGIFNAYRVPIDGSPKTQLTDSDNNTIYAVSWFPQDDRILYTADQGGNELNHLYVRETDGIVKDLTPGDQLKARFISWHDNDRQFYVATNERDAKFFDVYLYAIDDYSRELVFTNEEGYNISGISPDGRWLVAGKTNSNADSDLYLFDLMVNQPAPQHITEHDGDVQFNVYNFTPDSEQLIYGSNANGEFNRAWRYDLSSQVHSPYYSADWDVSGVGFSDNGQYRVVAVNEDARTNLYITDLESNQPLALPDLPQGNLRGVNFSDDADTMVFYLATDTSPANLYVHQIGTDRVTRLSETGNPAIDENHLVSGEVRRFASFDGLQIPGILYKPKQAAHQKVPALIYIHGGPGGQSRIGYSPLIQNLVNHGYAIFMINNRGSSGYGKTFFHLDDRKHGDHDLKDVVYNKYYLQSLDWVDGEKIAVIGGSYGGYLTMAAMAFTDEFAVGINIFGVTNWVRTLKSIPPYWESFRKSLYDELGDPATDEERLRAISPVFFGHQVKSPVLIVQGANDPRVLKIESDDMVEAIRSGGTYVDYLVFDDEGHGFSKTANQITASKKYLAFLDAYLK